MQSDCRLDETATTGAAILKDFAVRGTCNIHVRTGYAALTHFPENGNVITLRVPDSLLDAVRVIEKASANYGPPGIAG